MISMHNSNSMKSLAIGIVYWKSASDSSKEASLKKRYYYHTEKDRIINSISDAKNMYVLWEMIRKS